MKITRILNNNAVVVNEKGEEKIAIGGGIAFNKKRNDVVNINKIEKLFVAGENHKLKQLLARIPEEHFVVSEEIISYAERKLRISFNEHIYIALTDHISFAIEREQEGIQLKNKLLSVISALYKQEFEVALWATDLIESKFGIKMSADEAAFIAIHFHTMKSKGGDQRRTVIQTTILQEMIEEISRFIGKEIMGNDLSYQRLVTHLYFMFSRVNRFELHSIDWEIYTMIKRKYPEAYSCAVTVAEQVKRKYGISIPKEELGYITLHIARAKQY